MTIPSANFRRWTDEEKQQLFRQYFDRLPGVCPVCSGAVRMMLHSGGNSVTLHMFCSTCRNIGQITRAISQQPSALE